MRRNFLWMLVGNSTYAVCQWATLAVLAKLGSPEVVGQFNLGIAITAPVILLLSLNLRALQATDARDEYAFPAYLSLRLLCTGAAVAIVAGIALASGYEATTQSVILWIATAKGFESISDVVYGLLQKHERMSGIAGSLISRGALCLGLVASVWVSTEDIVWTSAAFAFGCFVVLSGRDLWSASRTATLSLATDRRTLARLFRTALPLGIVMMLINLNTNIPIYFLSSTHGEEAVGFYSAINYVGVAASMAVGALAQAAAPRFGRLVAASREREFYGLMRRLVLGSLVIGALSGAWAYFLGEATLTLLYTPDYAAYRPVFVLLMLGYGFGFAASFVGVALTARRDLRIMVPINLVTVAINLGLCWLLIPTSGMEGAAWAVVGALAFKLCANYAAASRRI